MSMTKNFNCFVTFFQLTVLLKIGRGHGLVGLVGLSKRYGYVFHLRPE